MCTIASLHFCNIWHHNTNRFYEYPTAGRKGQLCRLSIYYMQHNNNFCLLYSFLNQECWDGQNCELSSLRINMLMSPCCCIPRWVIPFWSLGASIKEYIQYLQTSDLSTKTMWLQFWGEKITQTNLLNTQKTRKYVRLYRLYGITKIWWKSNKNYINYIIWRCFLKNYAARYQKILTLNTCHTFTNSHICPLMSISRKGPVPSG